jgi:hypothetical protein
MSHYGPHGDPGRRGPEEYGPPSDPWGAAPVPDSWSDYSPTVPRHSSYSSGYDPYDDSYSGRSMPPPRRNVGLYALVAVLVVLAAGAVGYALYLLSGDDPAEPAAGGDTPAPTTSAAPSGSPAASAPPRDNIGMNAAMAQVDDCLVNDGTDEQPQMRIVACDADDGSQVYQVLAIFTERIEAEGAAADEQAQEICSGTEGYRYHYYEVNDSAGFVLCMTDV